MDKIFLLFLDKDGFVVFGCWFGVFWGGVRGVVWGFLELKGRFMFKHVNN